MVRWRGLRIGLLPRLEGQLGGFFRHGTRRVTILVSSVVGVVCGVAAAALKHLAHWLTGVVGSAIDSRAESLLYLVIPGVGILLTMLFVRYVVRDSIGHGVSRILYAFSRDRGRIKLHNTYSSIVSSSITIGFGGSVGAEAPIVLTGAAIGSNIARRFHLDAKTLNLMVACGAAAGIAAIFRAPLAGMVFTLEVLMLDLTMSSIVPLLVSAVSATIVSFFLLGGKALFRFVYNVPFDVSKSLYYVILGVFMGLLSVYFTRVALGMEGWFARRANAFRRVLLGALILGGLIFLFPPLYGEGYITIQSLFEGKVSFLFTGGPVEFVLGNEWLTLAALGSLMLLKVVAMAATTGAGGVGGSFAPTLFVGGVGGVFAARLLNRLVDAGVGVSNFVLVGMAGAMAGVMHAPLLGIFLIAELTEGYALLLPLMITATTAYITVSSIDRHSIYTKRLAAEGHLITHHKDQAVLTMLQLGSLIETDLTMVYPEESLGELVRKVARSRRNIFPVLTVDGALLGIVLLDDIREIMFETSLYEARRVRDLMVRPPATVGHDEAMSSVMEKFESSGAWNLPVVRDGVYLGFVSKSKIFSAYRNQLMRLSNE